MVQKTKRNRKRRQPRRGTLIVISVLLIGSAAIRIGDDAGQALARVSDKIDVSNLDPVPRGAVCKSPEDVQLVLGALRTRESRVLVQEAAIQDRMQALKIADQEVARKLAALTQAEDALRETIALADTAAEGDLARLTKVYESMKPKQAAALFEEMNPEFAAGFLGRMRPESAAGIMAGLSPQAAHTFSVVLAGRNANVPSE